MCTYLTEKVDVTGSGKGGAGWFRLSEASVYFDHPVHAPAEHTLNIDFLNPGQGPSALVAVTKSRVDSSDANKQMQAELVKRELDRQGTADAVAYLEDVRRKADVRKNPKAFE